MVDKLDRRLATLQESLKRVLASPTFLGNPLLTVLDAFQVALDAPRIDAKIAGKIEPYSSALKRERNEDTRQWNPSLSGVHDRVHWSLEVAEGGLPPDTRIRKALIASSRRVIFRFEPPLPFQDSALTELALWICDSSGLFADDGTGSIVAEHAAEIIGTLHAAARIVRDAVRQPDPFEEITAALDEPLEGGPSKVRQFLEKLFEQFDQWLKNLLQDQAPSKMPEYDFLNQFFWVIRQASRSTLEEPATVTPVFLARQSVRLTAEGKKRKTSDTEIESAIRAQLDSCSLFSAFPADTGLSLYVEDWFHEPLSERPYLQGKELERHKLFRQLTRSAHESAAEAAGLQKQGELNLFAVPVLIGVHPILVIMMSLPQKLTFEQRTNLATHIRFLGGIMYLRAMLCEQDRRREREQFFERERRNIMSEAAVASYIVNDVFGRIPSTIVSPLRDALENGGMSSPLSSKVKSAIRSWDEIQAEVYTRLKEFDKAQDTIDLIEALSAATPYRAEVETHPESPGPWEVKGGKHSLVFAFHEIITSAVDLHAGGHPLKIQLRESVEFLIGRSVRVEFLDNRELQNRKPFRAMVSERGEEAVFEIVRHEVKKINGQLDFDQEVNDLKQSALRYACCVVTLPLI